VTIGVQPPHVAIADADGVPEGAPVAAVTASNTTRIWAEACIAEVMLVRLRRFDRAYNWHSVARIALGLRA
jgi:hypothetical protein